MDYWVNKAINGGACWPREETTIKFGGYELILKPATKDTEQSIHIKLGRGLSESAAITLMNRFLSIIAWCDGQGMELMYGIGSSNVIPAPLPKRNRFLGSSIVFPFYRDLSENPKIRLALALYREGLAVNSVPFSFLSYFKILNIFWKDNELIEGIRTMLPQVKDELALQRLEELAKTKKDIPSYLYASGRCAIAHAYSDPIIDPDDETHLNRLSWDILIIKDIATYLIEHELGVSKSIIE